MRKRSMIRRIRRLLHHYGLAMRRRRRDAEKPPGATFQWLSGKLAAPPCNSLAPPKITVIDDPPPTCQEAAVFSVLGRRQQHGKLEEKIADPFFNRRQALAFAQGLAMQGWTVDVFRTVIRPADVEAKEAELHLRIKEASEGVIGYRPWLPAAIGVG
jgi:hypothetical protein